ncbi:MAG: U32 family peptidase, partial [Tannerella sp.]|nr:U32 family peptidase [Tannerella sp.]
ETGFSRIVLARELTINEIQTISEAVPQARLEAFVHGSLCVSYSGRCYLSAALNGRSANRGECAQCCRLRYSLLDADGQKIGADKHYLSLKDMNCADDLEAMMRAGVVSFKIEGRLKDMSYIKNITAYYRQRLDAIFAADPAYYRASTGRSAYTFSPQPAKSFNRGFTTCFLHGRDIEITSFDTPKSVGEAIGRVKEIKGNTFTVAGLKPVHNGDGLAFFNAHGELEGFRVNRAEANRIYPQQMTQQTQQKQQTSHLPQIPPKQFHLPQPKTLLFRNYDHEFETILSRPSAERRIAVRMEWGDYPEGFALTATDETDARAIILRPFGKEIARKPQADNIRRQLSKSGDTPFEALEIIICGKDNYFVPSSLLSEMRREVLERLVTVRRIRYHRLYVKHSEYDRAVVYPTSKPDYTANVYNREAVEFYRRHGVEVVEPAFEEAPREDVAVMTARHCLKYSLGWCPVHHKTQSPCREPFYLSHGDNRLRLEFDCRNCCMKIYNTK